MLEEPEVAADPETIIERMTETFTRRTAARPGRVTTDERAEAEALIESKFGTEAWTYLLP